MIQSECGDSPASPTGPFAGAVPDAWMDIDRSLYGFTLDWRMLPGTGGSPMPHSCPADPWLLSGVPDGDPILRSLRQGIGAFASPLFDSMRAAHAGWVVLGLAPRSLLVSRDVDAAVDALERCTLGPFARRR